MNKFPRNHSITGRPPAAANGETAATSNVFVWSHFHHTNRTANKLAPSLELPTLSGKMCVYTNVRVCVRGSMASQKFQKNDAGWLGTPRRGSSVAPKRTNEELNGHAQSTAVVHQLSLSATYTAGHSFSLQTFGARLHRQQVRGVGAAVGNPVACPAYRTEGMTPRMTTKNMQDFGSGVRRMAPQLAG